MQQKGSRMIKMINGDRCHELLTQKQIGALAFDPERPYLPWRQAVREKLFELLGLNRIAENACPLSIQIEERTETDTYSRIRFTYDSEYGNPVPAYLLIPKTAQKSHPIAIALQGHTTGFHNSVGIIRYEQDRDNQPDDCFGLQAVAHGFAALCIEQRGMGETRSGRYPGPGGVHQCSFTAMTALQLGRTVIGERVWDVMRGIDALGALEMDALDTDKIMILGTSGGGTAAFYAACCEERIAYAAPACAFCSYRSSIMDILHCVCNNIPNISLWFEMEDLSCLIAPRPLTVLAGREDMIFPLDGVEQSYVVAQNIYEAAGAADRCRLVIMPKGHQFCPDVAWTAMIEETKKLGWEMGGKL